MTWTQRSSHRVTGWRWSSQRKTHQCPPPPAGGACFARRGVGKSRVTSYELPVTPKNAARNDHRGLSTKSRTLLPPRHLPPTRRVARGPVSCHPSNGGELCYVPSQSKFPSAEGCREAAGWSSQRKTHQCPPPPAGGACFARRGVGKSRVTSYE